MSSIIIVIVYYNSCSVVDAVDVNDDDMKSIYIP